MSVERTMSAITDAYCSAEGLPHKATTTKAEQDAALAGLVVAAEIRGYTVGYALFGAGMNPFANGALADAWERGRMRGQAEALRRSGLLDRARE